MSDEEFAEEQRRTASWYNNLPNNIREVTGADETTEINKQILNHANNPNERDRFRIVMAPVYLAAGIDDVEDLENRYRELGVSRPEKWAKKYETFFRIRGIR